MSLILRFKLPIIIFVALIARIFSIYFFRDLFIANEWGIILRNLEENNILSVHSVQGVPVPNIFMPPLYPLFLYSIKLLFSNTDNFVLIVQYIQLFFALITVYFTYKILLEFFSENLSAFGTLVFALFPLNVYAVSQISSITIQIFLLNIYLYSFLILLKQINLKFSLLFSISSGLLILLERVFYFCFFIINLFIFKK